MSDKKWGQLLEADRLIRALSPNKGMTDKIEEPQIRITLVRGFELFNTRPYHNYENWSDGYIAEAIDKEGGIIAIARREDLDDVLKALKVLLSSDFHTAGEMSVARIKAKNEAADDLSRA